MSSHYTNISLSGYLPERSVATLPKRIGLAWLELLYSVAVQLCWSELQGRLKSDQRPITLHHRPFRFDLFEHDYTCRHCGARRLTLWEVPPENLEAPPVTIGDFQKVMGHAFSTVSQEELKRFEEWTAQFGQEGD